MYVYTKIIVRVFRRIRCIIIHMIFFSCIIIHMIFFLPIQSVKPVVVINERTGADPNDPIPNLLVDLPLLHTLVKVSASMLQPT